MKGSPVQIRASASHSRAVPVQIRTKLKGYGRQTPNRIRTFHAGSSSLSMQARCSAPRGCSRRSFGGHGGILLRWTSLRIDPNQRNGSARGLLRTRSDRRTASVIVDEVAQRFCDPPVGDLGQPGDNVMAQSMSRPLCTEPVRDAQVNRGALTAAGGIVDSIDPGAGLLHWPRIQASTIETKIELFTRKALRRRSPPNYSLGGRQRSRWKYGACGG